MLQCPPLPLRPFVSSPAISAPHRRCEEVCRTPGLSSLTCLVLSWYVSLSRSTVGPFCCFLCRSPRYCPNLRRGWETNQLPHIYDYLLSAAATPGGQFFPTKAAANKSTTNRSKFSLGSGWHGRVTQVRSLRLRLLLHTLRLAVSRRQTASTYNSLYTTCHSAQTSASRCPLMTSAMTSPPPLPVATSWTCRRAWATGDDRSPPICTQEFLSDVALAVENDRHKDDYSTSETLQIECRTGSLKGGMALYLEWLLSEFRRIISLKIS